MLDRVIKKLHPDGTLLETWGIETGVEFGWLAGISVDIQGYIYVIATGNNAINKLNAEGEPIASWGGFGVAPGQMSSPVDIAVGPDLKVYITGGSLNRVQAFRRSKFVPFNQRAITFLLSATIYCASRYYWLVALPPGGTVSNRRCL